MRNRTPEQIFAQTLELAAALYDLRGYVAPAGHRFDKTTHPHEIAAWRAACLSQVMLTATDPEDAISEIEP